MEPDHSPPPAVRWAGVLLIGLGCAGGSVLALHRLFTTTSADLPFPIHLAPLPTAILLGEPFLAALLAALVTGARRRASEAFRTASDPVSAALPSAAPPPAPETIVSTAPRSAGEDGLRLLGLLQQSGRFLDFVTADLGRYTNEEIGEGMRAVHAGCRRALDGLLELSPIIAAAEGETVTIDRRYDPSELLVTGRVPAAPPYRGVLHHAGWRTDGLKLPEPSPDADPSILARAEVEAL